MKYKSDLFPFFGQYLNLVLNDLLTFISADTNRLVSSLSPYMCTAAATLKSQVHMNGVFFRSAIMTGHSGSLAAIPVQKDKFLNKKNVKNTLALNAL